MALDKLSSSRFVKMFADETVEILAEKGRNVSVAASQIQHGGVPVSSTSRSLSDDIKA